MQYFITPHHCIAINGKAASTSIAEAIVKAHYPERIDNLSPEDGDLAYRPLVEQTEKPDKPVLLLVREPVDRFLSAITMLGLSVEEGMESDDIHLVSQDEFLPALCYRLPEDIDAFCKVAGLPEIPVLNVGRKKPSITAKQRAAIENKYAEDVRLFNSL